MSPFRRRLLVAWWRLINPPTRLLAGYAPWWVLLETTGARTGRRRRTPLASGPVDSDGTWLIAVHGRRAGWVCNVAARSDVRIKHKGRWHDATATIHPIAAVPLERFSVYARSGPRLLGLDPLLVRIAY